MAPWLVVSDVDHTLLETPGDAALAGECLRSLQGRGIATLLASSKTFAEMVALQQAAGLAPQPFLFENGAGIGWPLDRWPVGADAAICCEGGYGALVEAGDGTRLSSLLVAIRRQLNLRFTLLAELDALEIGRRLALPEPLARRALQRLASLPLIWQDDEAALDRLRRQLAVHGLEAVSGGQLLHVAPPGGKGETLARLRPWLAALGLEPSAPVLACGDSENDRSLLEGAAIALVFHPPDRPPLALSDPPPAHCLLRRSVSAAGPRRWLEAVEAALAQVAEAQGR